MLCCIPCACSRGASQPVQQLRDPFASLGRQMAAGLVGSSLWMPEIWSCRDGVAFSQRRSLRLEGQGRQRPQAPTCLAVQLACAWCCWAALGAVLSPESTLPKCSVSSNHAGWGRCGMDRAAVTQGRACPLPSSAPQCGSESWGCKATLSCCSVAQTIVNPVEVW